MGESIPRQKVRLTAALAADVGRQHGALRALTKRLDLTALDELLKRERATRLPSAVTVLE